MLGRGAGVLHGLLHHLRLYFRQTRKLVVDNVVAVLLADEGDALLHDFRLAAHQSAHLFHVRRSDGDDALGLVAIVHDFVAIVVGLTVADGRQIDADLAVLQSCSLQEGHHFLVLLLNEFVHGRGVVAQLLVDEGPGDFIGRNLAFGEALHSHFAVLRTETHDATADATAQLAQSQGHDDGGNGQLKVF